MKFSVYTTVFGVIATIIILAVLSSYLFNFNSQQIPANGVTLSSLKYYGPAPAISGISGWINSQPLNISQLKGKVVLVDFWTYSCINCIRTIPYLNALQQKYGNGGLVIIGVSTPEFQFEHNYTNVANAVQRFGIKYPVALDNNYSTWTNFNNHYWPADYLINASGIIRYEVFGEGDFNTTERAIQVLLQNAGYNPPMGYINFTDTANFLLINSPEIYLGYSTERQPIGNPQGFSANKTVNYTLYSNTLTPNVAYFLGNWYDAPDGMISVNGSKLFLAYSAKYVNIVASGTNSLITVKLDSHNLNSSYVGSDMKIANGIATANVSASRLYNIVAGSSYGQHLLEIDAAPGFKIYTFTFG